MKLEEAQRDIKPLSPSLFAIISLSSYPGSGLAMYCLQAKSSLWSVLIQSKSEEYFFYIFKCLKKSNKNIQLHVQLYKVQISVSINSFIGTQLLSFISILSVAAFMLQAELSSDTDYMVMNLKYLLLGPLQEKKKKKLS